LIRAAGCELGMLSSSFFLTGFANGDAHFAFLVAIVATAINSIAGGGGLLTFPVLMTVLPRVTANATSAVALLPAYMTSTWAGRKHLAPVRHWFWRLLVPTHTAHIAPVANSEC
jgi:uncharacterized membrane protein YfcA